MNFARIHSCLCHQRKLPAHLHLDKLLNHYFQSRLIREPV